MNKTEMMNAWETRKTEYANRWKTGLCGAPVNEPVCCCLSLCCPCCASYALRKRTIYNNMENYQCCGGYLPCSGRCSESSFPELCLCLEVCCCFGTSVAVTRWMIQDEMRVQNSACDNCLLGTMLFMQQLACVCQVAACITGDESLAQLADLISFLAEVLWWSVCACLQTQHKMQLDERDRMGGAGGGVVQAPTHAPMPQPAPMYQSGPTGYAQQGYGGSQYPPPGYPAVQQPYGGQQQMYR